MANLNLDKKRIADLEKLTALGGPFTRSEDVLEYLGREDLSEGEKNGRLYVEVRHAKSSSLSFPKSNEIFRLKKGGKNLDSQVYASNLCAYLDKVSYKVNLLPEDFNQVLEKLQV